VDVPAPGLPSYAEPANRWRRTAIVTAAVAAVEAGLLLVVALAFIAKPFADDSAKPAPAKAEPSAAAADPAPPVEAPAPARSAEADPVAALPRTKTGVLVLNGNGVPGAAGQAADQVQRLRYPVTGASNAESRDFARTIVMFGPGFEGEALRLAHDLGFGSKRVVPLDGVRPADLGPAKLVLVIGG
jgi:hypothetical protein